MAQKKRKRPSASGKGNQPGALHSLLWYILGLALGLAILLPLLFWDSGGSEDTGGERPAPEKRDRPQQGAAPATSPPAEPDADRADQQPAQRAQPAPPPPANGASDGSASPPQAEADEDGSYRFYTLLPEMEVEVPERAPDDGDPAETPAPDQPPEPAAEPSPDEPLPQAEESGHFLVQVAAFRQQTAAEDLKARLAMRGLQARVVTADLGDRGTWHRVRLGPYPGRGEAERVRDHLADDGMQGMIVRK